MGLVQTKLAVGLVQTKPAVGPVQTKPAVVAESTVMDPTVVKLVVGLVEGLPEGVELVRRPEPVEPVEARLRVV